MIYINESNAIVKHICNSHEPTLKPKITKELAKPTQKEKTTKRQHALINNCRDGSKFNSCSPQQVLCNLKGKYSEIGNYS